jgi:hypothetical protein
LLIFETHGTAARRFGVERHDLNEWMNEWMIGIHRRRHFAAPAILPCFQPVCWMLIVIIDEVASTA